MRISKCVVLEKLFPENWRYTHGIITWRPEGKACISKIIETRTKNMFVISSPSYDVTAVKRWASANVLSLRNSSLKIDLTHVVSLRDVRKGKPVFPKFFKTRTKNMFVITLPSYDVTPVKRWASENALSSRNSFLKIDATHMVSLRDVRKGKPVFPKFLRPGQKTCLLSLRHHMR